MCAGAAPAGRVTQAARQITREIGSALAAPGEPGRAGGWIAWTS